MGLLGNIFAGGLAGLGTAGMQVGMEKMREEATSEREKAADLRRQNLLQLEQNIKDKSEIAKENRTEDKTWSIQNEDGTLSPIKTGDIERKKKADSAAKINEDFDRQQYAAIEAAKAKYNSPEATEERRLQTELDPNFKEPAIPKLDNGVLQEVKDRNAAELEKANKLEEEAGDQPKGKLVRTASVEAAIKRAEDAQAKADAAKISAEAKIEAERMRGETSRSNAELSAATSRENEKSRAATSAENARLRNEKPTATELKIDEAKRLEDESKAKREAATAKAAKFEETKKQIKKERGPVSWVSDAEVEERMNKPSGLIGDTKGGVSKPPLTKEQAQKLAKQRGLI